MTECPTLQRVLATDSTNNTAFAPPADTTVDPTGSAGYIKRGDGAVSMSKDLLALIPVAKGAENSTFIVTVCAVYLTSEGVYVHIPLYQLTCTMGQAVGLSGKNISELHRYCDILEITSLYGDANVNIQIKTQSANGRSLAVMDMFGALLAYVHFDIASGATHMNALHGGF